MTESFIYVTIWAASRQNHYNGFATSMYLDQPAHPHRLIRIHMLFAISFSTCYTVCKRTAWILIRLRACACWSGSMLVANTLCWFCLDAAYIVFYLDPNVTIWIIYLIVVKWHNSFSNWTSENISHHKLDRFL
jgi:hypothetical protein